MSSRLIIKSLIILLIFAMAFFLYRYIFVPSQSASDTPGLEAVGVGYGSTAAVSSAADDEFIRLLQRLQGVKLNSDLFTSPAWKSLINFRVELVPEPKGRRNPFSPTGFDFFAPLSTTTSTSTRPATTPPNL
ncbi:MAG TPA: hypothetical protein VJB69_01770 [Candidatus Paceibacterota bacterium]